MAHHRTETRPSRRYSCGMIALRPDRDGDGHIRGYEGTEGTEGTEGISEPA